MVEKLVTLAPEQNPAKYYVEGQQMLVILDNIHNDKVGGYILGIRVTQSYLRNLKEKNPILKQCQELFSTLPFHTQIRSENQSQ